MNINIKKFLSDKNNLILSVILIIGVVLLMFSGHRSDTPPAADDSGRLQAILESIEGTGKVNVMITYDYSENEAHPRASGAVITAEGADNPDVKKAVCDAVAAALDLPVHKIAVYKGNAG